MGSNFYKLTIFACLDEEGSPFPFWGKLHVSLGGN